MEKKDITPKTREQIFKEKADTYSVCYSTVCPLREHCLHSILSAYTPQDRMLVQSVNLTNPEMQREGCPWFRNDEPIRMPVGLSTIYYDMPREGCPWFRNDEPIRMPVGLSTIYYDMPGRIERAIKNHLIHVYSRKRYYEYHNGTRSLTPDVERYVRQTLKNYGWNQEPTFRGYVEDYLW